MKSYHKHPGLCAAAILAWLNATAGAAPIFTENFNTYFRLRRGRLFECRPGDGRG
jgi:hypothetical protein